MADGMHSTGRGGAGNIGKDDSAYVDAGIVREGVYGGSDKPEYSSGRGGAGNIVDSPRMGAARGMPSEDVIPETATRTGDYENFHTGRGGEGNIHKQKYGGHSGPQDKESLGEKVKHLFGKDGTKHDK
ncbi:hypothetical protein H2203_005016 [Taxawa tesnikishii (nom. ined.)]|nr:hypothetical protein H2203_005016 [Dothideales sp. JES 119]